MEYTTLLINLLKVSDGFKVPTILIQENRSERADQDLTSNANIQESQDSILNEIESQMYTYDPVEVGAMETQMFVDDIQSQIFTNDCISNDSQVQDQNMSVAGTSDTTYLEGATLPSISPLSRSIADDDPDKSIPSNNTPVLIMSNTEMQERDAVAEPSQNDEVTTSIPSHAEGSTQSATQLEVITEPLNTNDEIMEIRKCLLRVNKMRNVGYGKLRKTIAGIFNIINRLQRCTNRTKLTRVNQLSASFLHFFVKIVSCRDLLSENTHYLFKVAINCYTLNFQYFSKRDRLQFNMVFQFIFDLVHINSWKRIQLAKKRGGSFAIRIAGHKAKNRLTVFEENSKEQLQILLYYLTQLLFIIIKLKKEAFQLKDRIWLDEKFRKLMAFLIVNENVALLRTFRQNRAELYSTK